MFSGKSEELIRRVTRAVIARQTVAVFKPAIDDRYHQTQVASHSGRSIEAHAVQSSEDIRNLVYGNTPLLSSANPLPEVIAIDEAQFFDAALVPLLTEFADAGVRVILAGLDQDFRGEPFSFMPEVLARAEVVDKLTAICVVCGGPATRTQRLIGNRPARYDDPIVLVGASESYEARCRAHHEVLNPVLR
ncbi:thymidine kinase [Deinococcus roseus]|uniref:Thymidine kinase n=2 Tax=Deinococcus roseus TaxID=392414 RepID=A0ABQ2CU47_9DEIO|nr:thymidine kinase [Deinococcus roseus]